jgi:Ni,Fe-hydrogenase maturation factor
MDPHSPALVDTLLSAELFGVAPASLLLVGISAECYEASCSLSGSVKAALDQAVVEILRELDRNRVAYRTREPATALGAWWATDEKMESPLLAQ